MSREIVQDWHCPECKYIGVPKIVTVPPTWAEPDGIVNKCPKCGATDMW